MVVGQRAVIAQRIERAGAGELAQRTHDHFAFVWQFGGQLGQRLAILGDDTQVSALPFWQGVCFFQGQFLLAAKFKGVGDVIFVRGRVSQRQLPLITGWVEAKVEGLTGLIRTVHQHLLGALLRKLVGAAVVGEGNGDGADQREQNKQSHPGHTRINIAPGVSFTIRKNIEADRA